MKSNRWRALFAALALVVLGFALGVATTFVIGARAVRLAFNSPDSAPGLERLLARVEHDLTRSVDLDPAEKAAVHQELARTSDKIKDLRARTIGELRHDVADTVDRIASRLPPGKRTTFLREIQERLAWMHLDATPPATAPRDPRASTSP